MDFNSWPTGVIDKRRGRITAVKIGRAGSPEATLPGSLIQRKVQLGTPTESMIRILSVPKVSRTLLTYANKCEYFSI